MAFPLIAMAQGRRDTIVSREHLPAAFGAAAASH
jgi:hypothetical protein